MPDFCLHLFIIFAHGAEPKLLLTQPLPEGGGSLNEYTSNIFKRLRL